MDKLKIRDVEVRLVAFDIGLFYTWQKHFGSLENVSVLDGDILAYEADAIVSPANSFGYMDGSLDLKYSQHFGWDLENSLREYLERFHYGEIAVGQAVIIETGDTGIQYLISAPTMRVPMNVADTVNAYLAFKAVLQAVNDFNKSHHNQIRSILCPGLGTGEGKMSYEDCAFQMLQAYRVCAYDEMEKNGGLAGAARNHMKLLGKMM